MATLYEYYDEGDDSEASSATYNVHAQTFTPQASFSLGSIRTKIRRTGGSQTGSVDVHIYPTDGDGHPNIVVSPPSLLGESNTVAWADVPTTAGWVTFTFPTPISLVAGTKYSLNHSGGSSIRWQYDSAVSKYPRGAREYQAGGVGGWVTQVGSDFMFETWDTIDPNLRLYTLRGITDDKGRPIAEAECRAYNSSDQTNLVLVETRYTDGNGIAEFRFLPSNAPVDICVTWGSHVQWYRNVFNTDGSSLETAVSLAHTQNTDTGLGTLGTKNPPIDADKAIYRDSTTSDALVTSTWTQIKAFLKTYFDTLYAAITHASKHTDGTDDIQSATAAQKGLATATQITKLDGIEAGATKYPDTGEQAFLDADHTKLDGIEAAADVTDATNVAAAGALMNSVLTERGSIIYRNATIPAELLHGTDGQVLTTKGDGADPIWVDAAGGVSEGTVIALILGLGG